MTIKFNKTEIFYLPSDAQSLQHTFRLADQQVFLIRKKASIDSIAINPKP